MKLFISPFNMSTLYGSTSSRLHSETSTMFDFDFDECLTLDLPRDFEINIYVDNNGGEYIEAIPFSLLN